jgi:hypothetical protein
MPDDSLLPAIKRLISEMISEIGSEDGDAETYLTMAKTSPVIGAALQVITLMGVGMLGDYTHPDEEIQADMRGQFEQMQGSLALSIEELLSCYPFGYSSSQWGVEEREGQIKLIDIQILDPTLYGFEGKRGRVDNVVYRGDREDVRIPYNGEEGRIIHAVNARHLSFRDPTGVAVLKRVKPSWEAWKIVIGEMLIAAQRQATPIVVGYSDSGATVPMLDARGEPLLDPDGNPVLIQAPTALLDQLESLENRSVISTDIKNKIDTLSQQTSGTFFFECLKLLQSLQLIGLIFPETILGATGIGDSNLNKGQRSTLGLVLESLTGQIKEQILNNPVRWLLTWNYGDRIDNYGSFPPPKQQDVDSVQLFNAINSAVGSGYFSGADLSVLNRGRELVGLSPVEEPTQSMGRLLTGAGLDYWRNGNGTAAQNS